MTMWGWKEVIKEPLFKSHAANKPSTFCEAERPCFAWEFSFMASPILKDVGICWKRHRTNRTPTHGPLQMLSCEAVNMSLHKRRTSMVPWYDILRSGNCNEIFIEFPWPWCNGAMATVAMISDCRDVSMHAHAMSIFVYKSTCILFFGCFTFSPRLVKNPW